MTVAIQEAFIFIFKKKIFEISPQFFPVTRLYVDLPIPAKIWKHTEELCLLLFCNCSGVGSLGLLGKEEMHYFEERNSLLWEKNTFKILWNTI